MKPNPKWETPEVLSQLMRMYSYSEETGQFVNINKQCRRHYGKAAGTVANSGYVRIGARINGKLRYFVAHRMAVAFVEGKWPDGIVDHKFGDKLDNRYGMLRIVSKSTNAFNSPWRGKSQTGYRGVRVDKRRAIPRYQAVFGKKHLGMFNTAEEAAECYKTYVSLTQEVNPDAEV